MEYLVEQGGSDGVVRYGGRDVGPAGIAAALDALVETACELLDVDYAGVHIVQADSHVSLAGTHGDVPGAGTPRSDSICAVVLDGGDARLVEVPDAAEVPALRHHAFAGDGSTPIRFYAAAVLRSPDGSVVGTLCVISHHPRRLTALERRTLLHLGQAAAHILGW